MRTRAAGRPIALQIGAYLEELRGRRCAVDTVRRARRVLGHFSRQLRRRGRRDVRLIGEGEIVRYMRTLETLSPGTQRAYLVVVRSFFSFLVRRGRLISSPARELATPRVMQLPRGVPSQVEVRRLLGTARDGPRMSMRNQALLEVLYGSGVRREECVRLDLADLELREGTLWVRNGKGKKDRVVPLTVRALKALGSYLEEERPHLGTDPRETALFLSDRGRRLTGSGLAKLVRRTARRTGLDLSPHSLRHACATHLLQGGADVRQIQRLLGHKRLATTAVYTRVHPTELAEMLSRCHPSEARESGRTRRPVWRMPRAARRSQRSSFEEGES